MPPPERSAPDLAALDLSSPRRIHVVGVGGAGMSAIAAVLATMGHQVSGSDLKDSTGLARLRALGVRVEVGHDAAHLGDAEIVTVSTAIPAHNPEVVAARERGIPVWRRSEALAAISSSRRTLAVAGTHGKTTTSSMLALVMRTAGLDPSFIIGGEVNEIGGGAHWGAADWFVVEADESDGTFLDLPRHGAIVTNVEPDHLEHYGGFEPLLAAFDRFVAETPGPVVICLDDPLAADLAARAEGRAITYGTAADADYRMDDLVVDRTGASWRLHHGGVELARLELPLPGAHNARNATGAAALALEVGASIEAVTDALSRYGGVARRYEFRGEAAGVTFVDDYAHLPTEVLAVLDTATAGGFRRVVAVFQPHRYSRTEALWRTFADAFVDADVLVVTDIYSSGETPRPGVTGMLVADAVLDAHPFGRVVYLPRRDDLVAFVPRLLRDGDLCITLGAGDLTSLPTVWLEALSRDESSADEPSVEGGS